MKFIKTQKGTLVNVEHITSLGRDMGSMCIFINTIYGKEIIICRFESEEETERAYVSLCEELGKSYEIIDYLSYYKEYDE